MLEAVALFIAGVRAVAPGAGEGFVMRSGKDLLAWIESGRSVEQVLAGLTVAQREDLLYVLDGMLRERLLGAGGRR